MTAHARRPHDGARQIFLHAHSSVSVHATLCSSHTKQGVLCPAIQSASVWPAYERPPEGSTVPCMRPTGLLTETTGRHAGTMLMPSPPLAVPVEPLCNSKEMTCQTRWGECAQATLNIKMLALIASKATTQQARRWFDTKSAKAPVGCRLPATNTAAQDNMQGNSNPSKLNHKAAAAAAQKNPRIRSSCKTYIAGEGCWPTKRKPTAARGWK